MHFFTIVPEKSRFIVQRLGKYHKTLDAGFHFLIPVLDSIEHKVNLKEQTIHVDNQRAITKDNVALTIDGVVFFQIQDEQKASYNVANYQEGKQPSSALKLLAMTSMRSELGKIELNKIFQLRKELNNRIRETLEATTLTWGICCDRYEILKIEPPAEVRRSMQLQAEAERIKRKDIILSEARKHSDINVAEGKKQAEILNAEAQAEAVEIKARKEKEGLQLIAKNVMDGKSRGIRALDYILKRKYYDEYAKILKNGNITVLPDDEDGQGSDVLAAVAMMMNANRGQPHQTQHFQNQKHSEAEKSRHDDKRPPQPHPEQPKSQKGKRADANIDWDSISFFNNTSIDSKGR